MKRYLTIIFLLTFEICRGQNLVTNPSFEDTVNCPAGELNGLHNATGWISFSPSPDYFNSCSDSTTLYPQSVPRNFIGYQDAATGHAYGGMYSYFAYATFPFTTHELISTNLFSPLQIGTKYFASIKVNLADSSGIAIDRLGVSFRTAPVAENDSVHIPLWNNAFIYSSSIISDTSNWTIISGSFIADSAYQSIIIGNFFDSTLTDTMYLTQPAGSVYQYISYYYVDDVCVSTDSLTCNSTVGINEVKKEQEFILFPNPFFGKLNITTKRNEVVELSLYDITTRKLLQKKFTNSTTLNTEQLVKGIYLYEVRNKNGVVQNGKVAKE